MCYLEEYLSRSDKEETNETDLENITEEIGDIDDFIFANEIIKYESEK